MNSLRVLRFRCPRCSSELPNVEDTTKVQCGSCGFCLVHNGVLWDARVNFNYPLDFSRQWVLWEKGAFGDTRLIYGMTSQEAFEDMLQALQLGAADLSSMKILDVGFGSGRILRYLQNNSSTAFGIDLVKPLQSAGLKEKLLVCGSLFNIPFVPHQFDLVICRGVVHHTENVRLAFSKVAEQVAEGGKLYFFIYENSKRDMLAYVRIVFPISWMSPEMFRIKFARSLGMIMAVATGIKRRKISADDLRKYHGTCTLSVFDRISPRFVSRHKPSEVISWFNENGLSVERVRSGTYVGIRSNH